MKKIFFLLFAILLLNNFHSKAQSSSTTLDVIGWNLEYFGTPF